VSRRGWVALVFAAVAACAEGLPSDDPVPDAEVPYTLPDCPEDTICACDVTGWCVCAGEPCCGARPDAGLCDDRGDAGTRY
jgi:hypothetical protein